MSHILLQIPIAITRLHIVNLTSIFSISLHIKQLVWNYKKTHGKHQKINWISKLGDSVEQQNCQAYRNSWTLDARVEHWALDAGLWTLDSGRWTLDAGLWTLDTGRWTLDAEHWTLILRAALILCSQSWNDTWIILQTKNKDDSFFITGKYDTKKQNITSHLKVFLKTATH